MKFETRPEQERLIKIVCDDLAARIEDPSLQKEVVLAAAPASGKTVMSIAAASRLLAKKTFRRVLVLAHGTEIILDNYVKELREVGQHVGVKSDAWGTYRGAGDSFNGERIVVSLPQALIRVETLPEFDLVIVDEAHHYYHAPMVKSIVERVGAKAVLALTATPSPFVRAGTKTIRTLSLFDLYKLDRIADPVIYMAASDFDFVKADYNGSSGSQELRMNATSPKTANGRAKLKKQVFNTFDSMLVDLARAMASAQGFALREKSATQDWNALLEGNRKTMIVCHSQDMARAAADYFKAKHVRALLSVSDVEGSTDEILKFRNAPEEKLLIVVNRGALGFDCPSMMTLIDMTGTLNPDRIFQMICRTVRRNQRGAHGKIYVKVSSPAMAEVTDLWVHAALMLSDEEILRKWNGKDLSSMGRLVAPVSANAEQKQLLTFYKEMGKRVPQTHPLAEVQQELFDAGGPFLIEARKLLGQSVPNATRRKTRSGGNMIRRQPPLGFMLFRDHFVPRVDLGELNKDKSVRVYAETSLKRGLEQLDGKRSTLEQNFEAMKPEYEAEAERLGGFPDANTSRIGRWFSSLKKELVKRGRLPASLGA